MGTKTRMFSKQTDVRLLRRHLIHAVVAAGITIGDLRCLVMYFDTDTHDARLYQVSQLRVTQLIRVLRDDNRFTQRDLSQNIDAMFKQAIRDVGQFQQTPDDWNCMLALTSFDQLAILTARVDEKHTADNFHRLVLTCFGARVADELMHLRHLHVTLDQAAQILQHHMDYELLREMLQCDDVRELVRSKIEESARGLWSYICVFDSTSAVLSKDLRDSHGFDMDHARKPFADANASLEESDLAYMHAIVISAPSAGLTQIIAKTQAFVDRRANILAKHLQNFALMLLIDEPLRPLHTHKLSRLTSALMRAQHITEVLGDFARARSYDFIEQPMR